MSIKKIKNLDEAEQKEVKKELNNPFLLSIKATPYFGILLVFIGLFLELSYLVSTGLVLMFVGVIFMFFIMLRKGNTKEAIKVLILNVITVIIFFYLFLY